MYNSYRRYSRHIQQAKILQLNINTNFVILHTKVGILITNYKYFIYIKGKVKHTSG